ncbi:MAG: glutaredoxin family protein [Chloroflexi bacterium]|nr:glutaredoxin family protein [Chloroflexota bacterium]
MEHEIVMYSRTVPCPYVRTAKRVFERLNVSYREVFIDKDAAAEQRVIDWTGFKSVPTIVVARLGEDLPYEAPAPLLSDSPRGIDRGTMITEPGEATLEDWLGKHGFVK